MFCRHCGLDIPNDSKFCQSCGTQVKPLNCKSKNLRTKIKKVKRNKSDPGSKTRKKRRVKPGKSRAHPEAQLQKKAYDVHSKLDRALDKIIIRAEKRLLEKDVKVLKAAQFEFNEAYERVKIATIDKKKDAVNDLAIMSQKIKDSLVPIQKRIRKTNEKKMSWDPTGIMYDGTSKKAYDRRIAITSRITSSPLASNYPTSNPAPSTGAVGCPKCGATTTFPKTRGYSASQGFLGAFFLGPIGLAAGAIGSGKVRIKCLKCGYEWEV